MHDFDQSMTAVRTDEPRGEAPANLAFALLFSEFETMDMLVDTLANRLEPVVSSGPGFAEDPRVSPDHYGTSPTVRTIHDGVNRAKRVNEVLRVILDRLEV